MKCLLNVLAFYHSHMIYLKRLPFVDTFDSMQDLVSLDNLANLKKHLSVLGSWVPSNYRKADYVMAIHAMFLTYPLRFYEVLPVKEQKVVSKLLDMKADEYLTWPLKEDKELVMQTLHLVVSYEDGKQWRLYMPDCIRRELDRAQKAEFMELMRNIGFLK